MADISAKDVKALREKTGAGIAECKSALVQFEGNFEEAEKFLKEKGLKAVEKRAERTTNEGKIFIRIEGKAAAAAELASETDFVARNPEFIALGEAIVGRSLEKGYEEINEDLTGLVTDLAAKIKENMSLKRLKRLNAGEGEYLTGYVHGDGAIGVLVKLGADKPEVLDQEGVKSLAHDLALHIAWANPIAIDAGGLDAAFLLRKEEEFRAQMDEDEGLRGKPEKMLEGILRGKMSKFLKTSCLLDQGFVKEEKLTVAQVMEEAGKQAGAKLSVKEFLYFKVGG